jgi:short-subunit dehydrogenase
MAAFAGAVHYSATKTFDDMFSRTIEYELRFKVDVLTVRPFFVTSHMTKNTTSLTHATTEQTATETINCLGNTDICYGPFSHRIQAAFINLTSPKLVSVAVTKMVADFRKELSKVE